MAEFRMPSLGADMTAGRLLEWHKKPGDVVTRGDVIADVDTDKGVIEVEVFEDGIIEKLLVKEDEKVPVGTALAIIGAAPGTGATESGKVSAESTPSESAQRSRIHASPVARKLAEQLGIDLKTVKGTGPGGRIQREDIQLAAAESPAAPTKRIETGIEKTDGTGADRVSRMRQAIAAAMSRSKREIPHYYLATRIDMTKALEWLDDTNASRAIKDRILYSVLLLKAVALALRQVPELNATWENDRLNPIERINVGTAISLRHGGLVAPALKDTDRESLDVLMKNLHDLVRRTRAGELRSSDLSDSTITVTSIGEEGVETVYGVIYPPQVAIVGFGTIYESVSVDNGAIRPCRVINATLAADHRASDGHRGSIFLSAVEALLQEPEKL